MFDLDVFYRLSIIIFSVNFNYFISCLFVTSFSLLRLDQQNFTVGLTV